jgi:uncharacterized protein (DUF1330 family)
MSAYVVVHATIKNRDKLKEYSSAAGPTVEAHGGEFLGRGPSEALAGDDRHQVMVVIQFPNRQAATDWYHSEAYQAIVPTREQAMDADFILAGD